MGLESQEGIVISHLQFADNTMFFLGERKKNEVALKKLLNWFELVSGLRKLEQSKLYKVGIVDGFEELAAILGCEVDRFPSMY